MKHALIIGIGDIGEAIAHHLKGMRLTLVSRDVKRLSKLGRVLGANVIPTDISNELEAKALFEELEPIDLIIYSAGDIQPELLKQASSEAYRRVLDANLTGLFFSLKYGEGKLAKDARIYVLGARPELIQYRGFGIYAAAKAAVKALMDIAAIEMKRKAHFTLVLPKAVDTAFWKNVGAAPNDALRSEDVANAIVSSLGQEAQAELRVG